MRPSVNPNALGLVIALAATCLAALALLLPAAHGSQGPCGYLISYSTADTSSQRLAHKLLLCLLAALGLLSPWLAGALGGLLGPAKTAAVNRFAARLRRIPALFALPVLLLALWVYKGVDKDQNLLGLAVFGGLYFFGGRLAANRTARCLCGAGLVIYALFLLLPGFWGTYTFGAALEPALMHYFGQLGLAPLLAAGGDVLANKQAFYGLLPQTLLATAQRMGAHMDMGGYVLFVQASQVVFTLLGVLGYRLLAPSRPLASLFCVGLWLPWISTSGVAILGPTASGLRFMNFPVAILVLLCAGRLPDRIRSLVFGLTAGFALLHNLETGICVFLSFAVYNVISRPPSRFLAMLRDELLLLAGCLMSFAAFLLLFRLGLDRWPTASSADLFQFIRLFSSGFAGLPLYFDPLALLVLLYPACLIARLTRVWLGAGLSERMRFKFCVSFLILLWLAYYFNRVHRQNLWSHTFLLTYLLLDLLPNPTNILARLQSGLRRKRAEVPAMALVLVFILGPTFMNNGLSEAKVVWRALAQRIALERNPSGQERLSGLWLDAQEARDIRERSLVVRRLAAEKRLFFVGPNMFLLQLESGVFFPLPAQDLLTESLSPEGFARNVAAVRAYAPDVVLLSDGGGSRLVFLERKAFISKVLASLGQEYGTVGSEGGWLVLERVRPAAAQ